MDVLTTLVPPALFTDENLLCLVICRMANLSLEHGNSDASCFAYVWLGMILGPHFGDYQAGFRFGQLGLDLVEQRGLTRFEARVYLDFGHRVIPWTQPRPDRPRSGAARLRCGQQDRRPHLCSLQLRQPDHEPPRQRRSARRGAARGRSRARLRAQGAVRLRH